MLVIRKEQIEHFIAEDNTQLVRVISEVMREAFHDEVKEYSDETLSSMVKVGIKRARSYDFDRAEEIASFVALMFEISPAFDTIKSINAVLTDSTIQHKYKFEQLIGRTTDEDWTTAEQTYKSEVWFPDDN